MKGGFVLNRMDLQQVIPLSSKKICDKLNICHVEKTANPTLVQAGLICEMNTQ